MSAVPSTAAESKLPALFVSHGAPTFALAPRDLGERLTELAAGWPRPRAVLVLSPHWVTRGLAVSTATQPETIHDFGGFPRPLYDLQYPAAGAPWLAERVQALLPDVALTAPARGLDHGAWVPLRYLYPQADVPVAQISLPWPTTPQALYALGQALAPLRSEGVLLLATGSLTHNLYHFDPDNLTVLPYAQAFVDWVADALARGDLDALLDYRRQAPGAAEAHPTDDHFLPLFFALGAGGLAGVQRIEGGIWYGMLGMDSYVFGEGT